MNTFSEYVTGIEAEPVNEAARIHKFTEDQKKVLACFRWNEKDKAPAEITSKDKSVNKLESLAWHWCAKCSEIKEQGLEDIAKQLEVKKIIVKVKGGRKWHMTAYGSDMVMKNYPNETPLGRAMQKAGVPPVKQ